MLACLFIYLFKSLFILREKEHKQERDRERERERERERDPSRLCTVSTELDMRLKLMSREIMI